MFRSKDDGTGRTQTIVRLPRRSAATLRWLAPVVVAVLFASLAFAAKPAPTLRAATNRTLGKTIVVDARGRTIYALSPESTRHLLCHGKACFSTWPPVTVQRHHAKLKLAAAIRGHLAILRRNDGRLQLTLRGMPLYRFAGDAAKGQANGGGIQSFGGTWHVVTAVAATTTPAPMTPPTPTTTTPTMTTPYTPMTGY